MKTIAISPALSLPIDAVTQTLACIGRKNAGKTYLAGLIAEQMLDAGAQVVIIDAVGNWYGLRIAADGKSKGKDIFIAGGERGDVPILPDSGARFAQLVVEKNISIVLDVSGFRQGERKRFAADFAEEFFHLKKTQKSAVHLFIEEAQLFVPQRTGPEEARMLGAFENIIRLGRNYGIGATMITQRPQSVNKEVLSQVECLCVLQVNGTHERKALEEWVQEAGADRKLVGELPGLARGEGYVWSPSWLRIFQRVRFGKKTTFDASATPEVGKAMKAAMLSAVDVEALKTDLQEVIAQASKDDPKALRQQIAQLQTDLRKATQTAAPAPVSLKPDPAAIQAILLSEMEKFWDLAYEKIGVRMAGEVRSIIDQMRRQTEVNAEFLSKFADTMADKTNWNFKDISAEGMKAAKTVRFIENSPESRAPTPAHSSAGRPIPLPPVAQRTSASQGDSGASLTGPERRILNAIAWLESIGVEQPEQPAVAFLAGYTYGGGAWNNPRGRLNVRGLIEYLPGNCIRLTDAGRNLAEAPDVPGSNAELHEKVLARLPGPEQRLLRPLLSAYPKSLTNEALATKAQYTAGAGAYNNPRGRLRSLGLIEYPQPGNVRAKDLLFPIGG
jgi:hypothetical protein